MRYNTILFDLDGTLVNSLPDIAATVNATLASLQLNAIDEETIALFVGKGSDNLLKRALAHTQQVDVTQIAPLQFEQAKTVYVEQYPKFNAKYSHIYDGVLDGLSAFKALGCRLGVVTNKEVAYAIPLLNSLKLAPYFDLIVGGDSTDHKKPHPEPLRFACEQMQTSGKHCLFIGDSNNDALAAQAAGMDVLLLPYGYNEGIDVQTLQANGIVSSIADAARWAIKAPH